MTAVTDGCEQMADIYDRIHVVLAAGDLNAWLHGTPEQAFALCQTRGRGLIVERTETPWSSRRAV